MWYQFADRTQPWVWFVMIPIMIWDLIIRGIALWKAARSGQNYWFIALLIVNSLGILPLVYLIFFQKKGLKK